MLEKRLEKHIDLLMKRYPILEKCRQDINDGYLMLEIGYNQGNAVITLKRENLKLITEQPIKDLAGNDRVVIFQKEG